MPKIERRLYLYRLLKRAPREALHLIAQETGRSYPVNRKGKKQAMKDLELTKAVAAELAQSCEQQASALLAKHGSGSRPSWVSAEVALFRADAAHYRKLEAELDE